MPELADVFADLEDPRAVNARLHSLHYILVIALGTMVCGGQTCADMELFGHAKREFLETFLPLPNGIPSHDTFSRALGMLDPAAFWGSWGSLLSMVPVWWRWTGRPVSSTGPALLSQAFPPERCTRIFDQSHRARPLGN